MRNSSGKGNSVSLLFVILLFFTLAICTLFTVLIGARGYENINDRMEDSYQSRTVLSYISNKVKQADQRSGIDVKDVEGQNVLLMKQLYGDTEYQTIVYYKDGQVMELFTEQNSGMSLADGTAIIESAPLSIEKVDENLIKVSLQGENPETLYLCMRCGGDSDEQ